MMNVLSSAGLGQTIAIVDRSGKVVGTSKHLLNIFNEAKSAYRERKAEITSARQGRVEGSRPPRPRRAYTTDDHSSVASSHRSRRTHGDSKKRSSHRRHSTSPARHHSSQRRSPQGQDKGVEGNPYGPPDAGHYNNQPPPFPPSAGARALDLAIPRRASVPIVAKRAMSTAGVDLDLAYGEPPPNLFTTEREEEAELKGLVGRVEGFLTEAKCLQHSATRTIEMLQSNPDAMAAVALTLAEISNLLKKMAPGAIVGLRRMAPAVFSLLASPQFLIAAGAGVGLTVVAFGGYKVVKKIQAKREAEDPQRLIALGADVGRIDNWRRGVADEEARSVGTSVEGEFITPIAANLSRLRLDDPTLGPSRPRVARASTIATSSSRGSTKSGSVRSSKTSSSSRPKPRRAQTTKETSTSKDKKRSIDGKSKPKPKPSPLRLMLRS